MITRMTDTDDDGSGTTGTIHNNAWLTSLQNVIDQRWDENDTTATGTQNALDSDDADYLRFNNASLISVNGLAAPSITMPGKRLALVSVGAGDVHIAHQSVSASASDRIITPGGVAIALTAGVGTALLVYEGSALRWRVISHAQGQAISYSMSWTGSGGDPAIGNGTLSSVYEMRGRHCRMRVFMTAGSTTTFGTGTWRFSLPFTATSSGFGAVGSVLCYDSSGTALYNGVVYLPSTTYVSMVANNALVTPTAPFTWAQSDFIQLTIDYQVA